MGRGEVRREHPRRRVEEPQDRRRRGRRTSNAPLPARHQPASGRTRTTPPHPTDQGQAEAETMTQTAANTSDPRRGDRLGATTPLGGDAASTGRRCWPASPVSCDHFDWATTSRPDRRADGRRPGPGVAGSGPPARPGRPRPAWSPWRPGRTPAYGTRMTTAWTRRGWGGHRNRIGGVQPAPPARHPDGEGAGQVSPLTIPMNMANGPAAYVACRLGAQAGAHTPVGLRVGCRSHLQGLDMIRLGRADVVVVGGTEACLHPMPMAGFSQMQAMSRRNDEPERASRPWDVDRDGFVLGEGAAVLVHRDPRARAGPRREDLRRTGRRRDHRRRPRHGAAQPGRRHPGAGHDIRAA